jgi:hypothetical protein
MMSSYIYWLSAQVFRQTVLKAIKYIVVHHIFFCWYCTGLQTDCHQSYQVHCSTPYILLLILYRFSDRLFSKLSSTLYYTLSSSVDIVQVFRQTVVKAIKYIVVHDIFCWYCTGLQRDCYQSYQVHCSTPYRLLLILYRCSDRLLSKLSSTL